MLGEFALVTVDRSRIEQLAEEGDRPAETVLGALRSLSFQLSGAQLGITVTSLILGFLAEPTIGRAIRPLVANVGIVSDTSVTTVSLGLALTSATAAQMVIGELIPKNLAIARPLATARAAGPPLRLVNGLFKYVILFLNAAANRTVRLLGIEPQEELLSARSLEELDLLIRTSLEEGALLQEEYSLLARSITFGDKTAADALVPRTSMEAIHRDATVADMEALALEHGYSRFPVFGSDLDDIAGVAYVKDGYAYPPAERRTKAVGDIMQEPLFVPESRPLGSLLVEMRRERKHLAVVIDEYAGTAGIITLEDLLEEIVGEIEDEYDLAEEAAPSEDGLPGVSTVSGMLRPDEVREATGLELPEGDYETLAGFLLSLFDRIPEQGDHASYEGWELKVVEMDRNRIATVLVVAPGRPEREATS